MKLKAIMLFMSLLFACREKEQGRVLLEPADKVLVVKSDKKMYLLRKGKVMRAYRIALGEDPVGDKIKEGDRKTPEGNYILDWRNSKSSCYKSIHISYPDSGDIKRAKRQKVSPGGSIMIHGLHPGMQIWGKEHVRFNWTYGCVAVTNEEMDEIWKNVKNGTPIEIKP